MDTLGGFAVPGRPPTAIFDRVSHAEINDSGRMGSFARVTGMGALTTCGGDQGIYLANASGSAVRANR